jgi:hypothetical protein
VVDSVALSRQFAILDVLLEFKYSPCEIVRRKIEPASTRLAAGRTLSDDQERSISRLRQLEAACPAD